jgi:hypothetical protein
VPTGGDRALIQRANRTSRHRPPHPEEKIQPSQIVSSGRFGSRGGLKLQRQFRNSLPHIVHL